MESTRENGENAENAEKHVDERLTSGGPLAHLADFITVCRLSHPVRVAIDGVDAAGKTTLADELAHIFTQRGRTVVRASIDGFHQPRAARYRRGVDSPEGYYEDSFNYAALRVALLLPLGPGGSGIYRTRVFDFRADAPIDDPPQTAPPDAILLFDGVFLLRPELYDLWDVRIFVEADFAVTLQRALKRDQQLFGDADAVRSRYAQRYIPGQRLYLERVRPRERADVIVENNDLTSPRLRWSR